MRRTKREALDTRAKIVDAAANVFLACGFAGASLESIAGKAGVTRGAVYNHFRNKAAVLDALFESADLPLDPFIVQPPAEEPDPLGQLHTQLSSRLRVALHTRDARRLYTIALTRCEVTVQTRIFHDRVTSAALRAELQIESTLRAASRLSQLPPDVDTRAAAVFIHAALSGFLRKRLSISGRPAASRDDTEAKQTLATAFHCIGAGPLCPAPRDAHPGRSASPVTL
ncbi:TetR family transcriptional regulator [Paraburkholderia tropica]|uniref:TetR family transcriptional regulator n=1 Tax=Paraburkholderia tropica TaxID=92647 RepID=UPI002AB1D793|nr:TetR family transcriptional regulator [Paraburkholderia tropica]